MPHIHAPQGNSAIINHLVDQRYTQELNFFELVLDFFRGYPKYDEIENEVTLLLKEIVKADTLEKAINGLQELRELIPPEDHDKINITPVMKPKSTGYYWKISIGNQTLKTEKEFLLSRYDVAFMHSITAPMKKTIPETDTQVLEKFYVALSNAESVEKIFKKNKDGHLEDHGSYLASRVEMLTKSLQAVYSGQKCTLDIDQTQKTVSLHVLNDQATQAIHIPLKLPTLFDKKNPAGLKQLEAYKASIEITVDPQLFGKLV